MKIKCVPCPDSHICNNNCQCFRYYCSFSNPFVYYLLASLFTLTPVHTHCRRIMRTAWNEIDKKKWNEVYVKMKLEYGFPFFFLSLLMAKGKTADNCFFSYSLEFFTFPFGISFCFMVHNISFSDWIICILSIAYLSVSVTGIFV